MIFWACVSLSIVSIILSTIALVFAMKTYVKFLAKENSTHSIQYIPVDDMSVPRDENGMEIITEELKKKFTDDDLDI